MSGFSRRTLGKTGLEVSPLGIGGGSGISDEDLRYAFEQGLNYFFFSSDLHHFAYRRSAQTLQTLCQAGSSLRDKVVLATVSYVTDPEKLLSALLDQFLELGIDYIDVFHWGWVTDQINLQPFLQITRDFKEGGPLSKAFLAMIGRVEEINQDLVKRGLVRHVGASFHSRQAARRYMADLDVLMLRYNLAHTGVETEIFPYLAGDKQQDPGIVVFNVAHNDIQTYLNKPPAGYPVGLYVPTIPDLYRFALSNPAVDVVLTGVANRAEIDQALAALEKGPFSREECDFLREYGALFERKPARMAVPARN